jgi:hypothetical protein
MPRPLRPRRRALRAAAVSCTLLVLPALAPAAASADYAAANTWGGGTVGRERSPDLGGAFPIEGALVSMVTGPDRARLSVSVRSARCVVNGTMRGVVTAQPGTVGDQLAVGVTARRTLTTRLEAGRSRARVTVALAPAAPGVLRGTVAARGTVTVGGRRRACVLRETVVLRSRAALGSPLTALTTAASAPRTGLVETTVPPRVRGSIAITKRRDGAYHAIWSVHQSCRSGSKRSTGDYVNLGRRFRVRADGSFRGREVTTRRGRTAEGRFHFRFVATISGRIDADGVARGRVAVSSRRKETGYYDLVCRMPSTPFAAAPSA